MKSHFLHTEWNNLIMANYVVPKELLLPFIPHKTELDFFEEKTFVSLVGFMFLNTRILGFSVPHHINFEEVNLRFYVKYNDHGKWKMKHFHIEKADEIETCYEWKYKNKWNKLVASSQKKSMPMRINSEEEFITEHYWGYTKYNKYKTYEYEITHPRWEIFKVLNYTIDCDFSGIYGNEFSFLSDTVPASVFMAKGSEVRIFHKKSLA